MIPYDLIKIGDMFRNPVFPDGVIYRVEDKNDKSELILIQGHSFKDGKKIGPCFWKAPSARLFSEHWRV